MSPEKTKLGPSLNDSPELATIVILNTLRIPTMASTQVENTPPGTPRYQPPLKSQYVQSSRQTIVQSSRQSNFVRQVPITPGSRGTIALPRRSVYPHGIQAPASQPTLSTRRDSVRVPQQQFSRNTVFARSLHQASQENCENSNAENRLPNNYSIKQACEFYGYDYDALVQDKKRIKYTGAGLIVMEQTEVDEALLKGIDVKFGLYYYKYVRMPGEELPDNIFSRLTVPVRIDQNEHATAQRASSMPRSSRAQRQTTRLLDCFKDKTNPVVAETETKFVPTHLGSIPSESIPTLPVNAVSHYPRSTTVMGINEEASRSPCLSYSKRTSSTMNSNDINMKRSQTQLLEINDQEFVRAEKIKQIRDKWDLFYQRVKNYLDKIENIGNNTLEQTLLETKLSLFATLTENIDDLLRNNEI
ncbi:unnamed protein product [Didymodactylos carnosus]|uniref:Uncharacterized protein n=1 Tax=Didymodactylos carnosus TaxID=1234261 RepID=A0A8S2GEK8_9BILA|nr:unnamed protein product [Didymodactylos carnosus]CAF3504103.1 unnamed protein product [Didymodactylos carnosus]